MKKSGFTLAELLITLSIIGVGAALMAPALSNLMPDKNKLRVLKYYANVANATNNLLDDNTIYWAKQVMSTGKDDCEGLECTYQPLVSPYNSATYSGENKYVNLMKDKLGLSSNKLPDGSLWTFTSNGSGVYTIDIDVNGSSKGKNCTFAKKCAKPDKFSMKVDKYGTVTANDPLLEAYLKNPLDMNNKKDDIAAAKKSSLYK